MKDENENSILYFDQSATGYSINVCFFNSFFHDIYELTFEKGKKKENGKEWEQKNKFSIGLDTGRKKNLESK